MLCKFRCQVKTFLFITIGVTIGEKNNMVNALGIKAAHHFLGTQFQSLKHLCCARRLDHLNSGFKTLAILEIGGRDNDLGTITECNNT